ncbi:MAG: hypothetical protein IJZ42_01495 [Lachnospiraceae bacterium]|nr:hypothetical protein [Lachnospiraceae bacterium]
MKTISQHLGQIILAVAAVALIIGVVLTFGSPVHNFMDGVMDKLYDVGNGPIWNVGGTTTNPDEGGSGAGGAGDEDSVLGLRRFKDSVNNAFTELLSEENIDSIFNDYGFTIAPLQSADGSATITALSCVGYNENQNEQGVVMVIEGLNIKGYLSLAEFNEIFPDPFNILSTANSTVDEWLLANTEPVEEEETYVIEAGTYRFNDMLDFSNVPQNIIHLGYSYNDYYYAILNANNFETDVGTYNGVFFGVGDTTVLEPLWGSGTLDTLNYDGWILDEQIIQTIPEDTEVSAEFFEWYTTNTKRVIEVDELPTEDIDTSVIYSVEDVLYKYENDTWFTYVDGAWTEYVAEDDSIVGTWVFNDTLDMTTYTSAYFQIDVTFTYSGQTGLTDCGMITFYTFSSSGNTVMTYIDDVEEVSGNQAYSTGSGWNPSSITGDFQTITITEEPTDETFISWLKANATKQ